MSNILTDKSASLPQANKLDLRAVPGGLEQYYLSSSEWNTAAQFIADARSGLMHPQAQWTGSDNYRDGNIGDAWTLNILGPLTGTSRWIFVRPTGNDTTGDGTIGTPYATIQKALDQLPKMLGHTSYFIDITGMNHDDAVSGALVFPDCVGIGVPGAVHNADQPRGNLQLLPGFPQGAPTEDYQGYWTSVAQVNLIALPQKYDAFKFRIMRWPIAGTNVNYGYDAVQWALFPPTNLLGVGINESVAGLTSSSPAQLNVAEPGVNSGSFVDSNMFLLKYTGNMFPILSTDIVVSGTISYNIVGSSVGFLGPPVEGDDAQIYRLGAVMSSTIRFNDMNYSLGLMGIDLNATLVQPPLISNSRVSFDVCNIRYDSNKWVFNNTQSTFSRCRIVGGSFAPCMCSVTKLFGCAVRNFDNSDNAALPVSYAHISNCYIEEGDMDDHGAMWADNSRFDQWVLSDGDDVYFHTEDCSFGRITTWADNAKQNPTQLYANNIAIVSNVTVPSGSSEIALHNCVANISLGHKGSDDPGFYPNYLRIQISPEFSNVVASINLNEMVDVTRSYIVGFGVNQPTWNADLTLSESMLPYTRFAEMGVVTTRDTASDPASLYNILSTKDGASLQASLSAGLVVSGNTGISSIGYCMSELVHDDNARSVIKVLSGGAVFSRNIQVNLVGQTTYEDWSFTNASVTHPFKSITYSYVDGLMSSKLSKVYGYFGRPVATHRTDFTYDNDGLVSQTTEVSNDATDLGW